MLEASQDPRIKLLTYAELEEVKGYVGNFEVKIRKKARFIDESKCTGCGDCAKVCPVEVPNPFDLGMALQKATYKPFPQAIPNKHVILKEGVSPCRTGCPLGVNPHGYVALIAAGRVEDALKLVLERLPFPGIMGRICTHPCQEQCNRSSVGGSIQIRALKRFVADHGKVSLGGEVPEERQERVAIVGAGPAGLMAAYELRRRGYKVTVFDALEAPGGMLRAGIPPYRLPREVIDQEVAPLEQMGVEFKLGVEVGKDLPWRELLQGHDALLVAIGAHRTVRLGLEGEDLPGVWQGLEFLKTVNLGTPPQVSGKVVIIGGGNTAIDAARTALRLGAEEVHIYYRRGREEMPASEEEIEGAEEEGVKFHFLVGPLRFLGQGRVEGVEFIRMRLGEPDEGGRRRPEPLEGTEFQVEADMVITAVGQAPDLGWAEELGLELEDGRLKVDPLTLQTSNPKVFAAGDVVTGPRTAVEAMAMGSRAAESIDRLLRGEDLKEGRELPAPRVPEVDLKEVEHRPVRRPPRRSPEERKRDFDEVELPYSPEEAQAEARRCINCAGCCECMSCVEACEAKAIEHQMTDSIETYKIGAIVVATGYELFDHSLYGEYGAGRIKDVITGLHFERMVNPTGPTGGHIVRPSDLKEPKRVVFIQCVGSRDAERGVPYCSGICCMYTAKQVILLKEHIPEAEAVVFYMDIRAPAKGYEEFIRRAQEEYGAIYIRGRVGRIYEENGKLIVQGTDTLSGQALEIEADLVVLATGVVAPEDGERIAQLLGLSRDEHGFFTELHPKLAPVETMSSGIYLAGCCQGPKDIPASVAQGSAAAGKVMALFSKDKLESDPQVAQVKDLRCIGCFKCRDVCPYGAIEEKETPWKKVVARVVETVCGGCGLCTATCPTGAIQLQNFTDNQLLGEVESLCLGWRRKSAA